MSEALSLCHVPLLPNFGTLGKLLLLSKPSVSSAAKRKQDSFSLQEFNEVQYLKVRSTRFSHPRGLLSSSVSLCLLT